METNRSARSRLAMLVRSRSVTNVSSDLVSKIRTPSSASTSFATRRVTSRTRSFSASPVGPVAQRARPHLARRAVEGHTNNGIGPGPLETDLVDQAIAERLGSGVPDEPDETNPRLLWAGQLDSICDGPR